VRFRLEQVRSGQNGMSSSGCSLAS
jgi:hypothetical protein